MNNYVLCLLSYKTKKTTKSLWCNLLPCYTKKKCMHKNNKNMNGEVWIAGF